MATIRISLDTDSMQLMLSHLNKSIGNGNNNAITANEYNAVKDIISKFSIALIKSGIQISLNTAITVNKEDRVTIQPWQVSSSYKDIQTDTAVDMVALFNTQSVPELEAYSTEQINSWAPEVKAQYEIIYASKLMESLS